MRNRHRDREERHREREKGDRQRERRDKRDRDRAREEERDKDTETEKRQRDRGEAQRLRHRGRRRDRASEPGRADLERPIRPPDQIASGLPGVSARASIVRGAAHSPAAGPSGSSRAAPPPRPSRQLSARARARALRWPSRARGPRAPARVAHGACAGQAPPGSPTARRGPGAGARGVASGRHGDGPTPRRTPAAGAVGVASGRVALGAEAAAPDTPAALPANASRARNVSFWVTPVSPPPPSKSRARRRRCLVCHKSIRDLAAWAGGGAQAARASASGLGLGLGVAAGALPGPSSRLQARSPPRLSDPRLPATRCPSPRCLSPGPGPGPEEDMLEHLSSLPTQMVTLPSGPGGGRVGCDLRGRGVLWGAGLCSGPRLGNVSLVMEPTPRFCFLFFSFSRITKARSWPNRCFRASFFFLQ